MVDYAPGSAALSVKGASTFHAVTVSRLLVHHLYVTVQHFVVVALYDGPHVFSATITYFEGIPVENFAERVFPRKVLINEFQKYSAEVGA